MNGSIDEAGPAADLLAAHSRSLSSKKGMSSRSAVLCPVIRCNESSGQLARQLVPRIRISLRTMLLFVAVTGLICREWPPAAYQVKRITGNLGARDRHWACERCGDRINWKTFHLTIVDESDVYIPEGLATLCEGCWSATVNEFQKLSSRAQPSVSASRGRPLRSLTYLIPPVSIPDHRFAMVRLFDENTARPFIGASYCPLEMGRVLAHVRGDDAQLYGSAGTGQRVAVREGRVQAGQ